MAKSKKVNKSKRELGIVFYSFIVFGVMFLALSIILIIFNSDSLDYSDFKHFDDYSEVLTQPESEYLVYYYTAECGACRFLKDDLLDFADENSYGMKIYFIDAILVTGVDYIGFNYTTPTMMMISQGAVVSTAVGSTEILNTLEIIENAS